ncbi:MAG: ribonuclease P protein component [Candidatus Cloacimonetes bacterium]|jgi:ribonuclease P protein component|nr:ribonuclease P protein component [Candidatus Cloacimonadota bacterium]MBT4331688.1 ribonuclease P protein component [Candidatus Cloacimonadota bacterium]MBT4576661.1 ribonuclease P protein component [Candidatus Cloacimonadota bacterium]MBT5419404.1 ribonuclease P protein component [Candidatus Cloacimonadota bacterium]
MLSITSKREYQSIYRDNIKTEGSLFVFLKKKILEDHFAAGIVVSKKVGNAVIRNKVKRRVRAFLREHEELHPAGVELVIIAKPDAGTAIWQKIKEELVQLFENIK